MCYVEFLINLESVCHSGFSQRKASLLNSLFWVGFGAGRFSGIPISSLISPISLIAVDLGLIALGSILLAIASEYSLWIGTFIFGLGNATIFPSGVSFSDKVTNMSGKWISLFTIGATIGATTIPVIGSQIIFRLVITQKNKSKYILGKYNFCKHLFSGRAAWFGYFLIMLASLNSLAFVGMYWQKNDKKEGTRVYKPIPESNQIVKVNDILLRSEM